MDDKILKNKLEALKNSRSRYEAYSKFAFSKKSNHKKIAMKSEKKSSLKSKSLSQTKKFQKNKTSKKSKIISDKIKKKVEIIKDNQDLNENNKPLKKKKNLIEDEEFELNIKSSRKWNDFKNREAKKGPFTYDEINKIRDAICHYAYENNLDEVDLINLVCEKQTKKDNGVWPKISECLPERSVQSIHNFCHRSLNPYNYKGNWSDEEIMKLIQLQNEFGCKWEKIGKILERTSTNVKDKWKEIGGINWELRKKDFDLISILKMLKYINQSISINTSKKSKISESNLCLNEEEENSKLKKNEKEVIIEDHTLENKDALIDEETNGILKYKYKFSDGLEIKKNVFFEINSKKKKFLIDSSLKQEKSKIIIKKLLTEILNFENLQKLFFNDKNQISWSIIADKIKIYSVDDLKNMWNKLLKELNLEKKHTTIQDLKMIKSILKNDYETLDEVNFSKIKNKRSEEENRRRLEEYIAFNDVYNIKPFRSTIEQIQEELESTDGANKINNDENEETAFQKEINLKKKIDILKYFRDFTSRKRSRSDE